MVHSARILILAFAINFIFGACNAAEIRLVQSLQSPEKFTWADFSGSFDEFGCQLKIDGIIKNGDVEKLDALLKTGVNADESGEEFGVGANVCLSSPGGSLEEGIKIAETLKKYNAATIVTEGSVCESACAIIFMAGNSNNRPNRSIYPTAKVGFHAPKLLLDSQSVYEASIVERAYDGAIRHISRIVDLKILPPAAMNMFVSTPSTSMSYIEHVSSVYENDITIVQKAPEEWRGSIKFQPINVIPSTSWQEMIDNSCLRVYRDIHNGEENIVIDPMTVDNGRHAAEEPIVNITDYSVVVSGFSHFPGMDASVDHCEVKIYLSEHSPSNIVVQFMGRHEINSYALWPEGAKVENILSYGRDVRSVVPEIKAKSTNIASCVAGSSTVSVINVNQFVNIRSGASLSDRIVATANRGQRIQVVQPNSWWFKETRRGRQCSEICSRYHQTPTNSTLASQAKQCVDDKEIWTKVRVNGREGYVSVYFLEAQ